MSDIRKLHQALSCMVEFDDEDGLIYVLKCALRILADTRLQRINDLEATINDLMIEPGPDVWEVMAGLRRRACIEVHVIE